MTATNRGVFALERIMRDSPKDHWNVVEVLAAFARSTDREAAPKRPDADVKAALTVLGRRPARRARELDRIRLSDADLRETLMRHGRLDRAALRGAWLEEVHWEHASLVGARLRKAHMRKADLEQANLHKAGLQGADLTGAKLQGAKLESADLSGAHLAGVKGTFDLSAAQLAQVHCLPNVDRCPEDRPSESTMDSPAPS